MIGEIKRFTDMIIIDIWVASYFSLFKKYEQRGLQATLAIFKILWFFNIFTILSEFVPITIPAGSISFLFATNSLAVASGILSWFLGETLEKRYFNKWCDFIKLSNKIPKILGILSMIIHYFASIYFVCFSFKNFNHLIR